MEDSTTLELKLPGFRFHPTDEEILSFYLKNMIFQKGPRVDVIGFLDIYHHEPWDLPGLAKTKTGEREWYFFVPREGRKGRPNRTTEKGFWKATGCERKVISLSNPKKMIGLKKTLVFYKGRAPRGCRTDWIMNEFRLPPHTTCPTLKAIVLCKIYRKATSLKVLEQKAEEETSKITCAAPITTAPSSIMVLKEQDDEEENDAFFVGNQQKNNEEETSVKSETSSSNRISFGEEKLADLVVPKPSVDWTDDPFWTTLPSPWLDNWAFYALNF